MNSIDRFVNNFEVKRRKKFWERKFNLKKELENILGIKKEQNGKTIIFLKLESYYFKVETFFSISEIRRTYYE